MTDLMARAAFGAEPREVAHGALRMVERAELALASVSYRREIASSTVFPLPKPGDVVQDAGRTLVWLGADQCLVAAERGRDMDFAAEVQEMAPEAAVTEQTGGWVVISVTGADLGAVLERLVNLPPDQIAPGRAARTMVHHMSVVVVRRGAEDVEFWGPGSSAGSLWHTVEAVVRRYGGIGE